MEPVRLLCPGTDPARRFRARTPDFYDGGSGTGLAQSSGMAMFTPTPAGTQKVDWLHWLYVRGNRAISCDVDVRGDGVYGLTRTRPEIRHGLSRARFQSSEQAPLRGDAPARQVIHHRSAAKGR
jgi:hypothetical protein